MAGSLRLELDKLKIGELALRSDGVRDLVNETTTRMGAKLEAELGEEDVVVVTNAGISRARGYVRRLDGGEVVDGRLSRILHGGAG